MRNARLTCQSHGDLDSPFVSLNYRFSKPQITEIIGNPINGTTGRNRSNMLCQHIAQVAWRLVGTAEIYLDRRPLLHN